MSAVSMNVTPRSRARWMVAIDSSQSVAPYHSLIPMQPRPWADTVNWPSVVVRAAQTVGGNADRPVGQSATLTLASDGQARHLAVISEQIGASGITRAG